MENFLNQMRVKFTGADENKADPDGSRDQRISIQKTLSFKEKKKTQNWLQKQFSRKGRDYDSKEIEHAAAIAAAAYAIDSQEVAEHMKSEIPEALLTRTKSKVDGTKSPISLLGSASKRFSGSFRSTDDRGKQVPISSVIDEKKTEKEITRAPSKKKTSTFTDKKPETPAPKVPPPPPPPPIRQTSTRPDPVRSLVPADTKRQTSTGPVIGETKAAEWERTELEKIRERYEKLKETIDSWENERKAKAKRKLNKQESELERRRLQALEKFQDNMKAIDKIAREARAQAEKRRNNEELKAKEKADVIRRTGKLPGICFCF